MQIKLENTAWQPSTSAAFMRSRDRHGDLSNMSFGFPIELGGLKFQGPEGLYQALKFPRFPEIQSDVARQRSGMDAKRTAYRHPHRVMPGWDAVKLDAMALTLALKLQQHPDSFGQALTRTRGLDIVEVSYRDQWWGAKPDCSATMHGVNALGRLLTLLRDMHREDPKTAARRMTAMADTAPFIINAKPTAPHPG